MALPCLSLKSTRRVVVLSAVVMNGCREIEAPVKSPVEEPNAFGDYTFKPIPSQASALTKMALVIFGGQCAWSIGGADQSSWPFQRTNAVSTICRTLPPPTSWTPGPAIPQPLSDFAGSAVIGNKIYLAGGLDPQGVPSSTMYTYTKAKGWVSDPEPMPLPLACGGAAVVNGKLYVYGATPSVNYPNATDCQDGGIYTNAFAVYDPALPASPRWRLLATPSGSCCRIGASVAAVGTRIYVIGDTRFAGSPNFNVDVYDVNTGQWLAPISPPYFMRFGGAAVSANGFLYYLGGYNGNFSFDPANLVHVYDPAADVWDDAHPLTSRRWNVSATAAGDRIVAVSDGTAEWHQVGKGTAVCDAHEPDDAPNMATPWTVFHPADYYLLYGASIHGRLCSSADRDLFSIVRNYGGAGMEFNLQLQPPPSKDYKLELLDPTGTTILASSSNVGAGAMEVINYTTPDQTSALVRVTSQDGSFDPSATYTLIATDYVSPKPVAVVYVQLADTIVGPGGSTQATARLFDEDGRLLVGRTVVWSSNDASIAQVDQSGLVSGVGGGTTSVVATSEGVSGGATLLTTRLGFVQVVAGTYHTCGRTTTGQVYCWGFNAEGQLGDGSTTDRVTPTPVRSAISFVTLSTQAHHTCGVAADGSAYCWGRNGTGALGDGTNTDRSSPTPVGGGVVFAGVSAGGLHTCGWTTNNATYCWGLNNQGQLGDGTTLDHRLPTRIPGYLSALTVAGWSHSCALALGGQAACWGYNGFGELGDGTTTSRSSPTPVIGITGVTELAAGDFHTCAHESSGRALCWGQNVFGQLGDNTYSDRYTPTTVFSSGLSHLAAGSSDTCAVSTYSEPFCWGNNSTGQLGNGTTSGRPTPGQVYGLVRATSIATGWGHSCGLTVTRALYCWGLNDHGQLGDGTTTTQLRPVRVH